MTKEKAHAPFKQVYLYHPETGEHTGPYDAQLSPLEKLGTYITPVHHTETTPPVAGKNQVPVFSNGVWSLQPDFRGQVWFDKNNGTPVEITKIGEVPDSLVAEYIPPPPTKEQLHVQAAAQIDGLADPVLRAVLIKKGIITQDDIDEHRTALIHSTVASIKK